MKIKTDHDDETTKSFVGVVKNYTIGYEIGGVFDYIEFNISDLNGNNYPCLHNNIKMKDPSMPGLVSLLSTSITYGLNVTATGRGSVTEDGHNVILSVTLNSPD